MSVLIESLSGINLEAAADLLSAAFQRPGNWINDLKFNIKIQPDGYFGAYVDGVLAGMVGATIYSAFAYVGLMGVHPEFQRRGVGLALMQHLLSRLDTRNIPLVLLDASPAGQPLYKKLGFVAGEPVYVYRRHNKQPITQCPLEIKYISTNDLDLLAHIDIQAFGANRSRLLLKLLEGYPERAFLLGDTLGQINGYLFARETRIGPWVMPGVEGAELLLQAALSLPFDEAVSVVVPGSNIKAMTLLESQGFEMIRENRHMMRGTGMRTGQSKRIFGQTSLSLG